MALKADSRGRSWTQTGSELSPLKYVFTGLPILKFALLSDTYCGVKNTMRELGKWRDKGSGPFRKINDDVALPSFFRRLTPY